MIPLRVSIRGFMSYRAEQVLSFDEAPLWVLLGQNGAGKSVVFDAITFALYGCHSRHKTIDQHDQDLINHREDDLAVEFDFLAGEQAYRVRRTLARQGKPMRGAYPLLPDGTGRTPGKQIPGTESKRGLERWVKEVVGFDFATFTSSVLLLQGQSEKLLQADPRDRYAILSQLIELTPYQQLHERADNLRKDHEHESKTLRERLHGAPEVSADDLAAVRRELDEAVSQYHTAQEQVDNLTRLLGESKQWELYVNELQAREAELQKASALLGREQEIQSSVVRFRQLEQAIAGLQLAIKQRERLRELIRQIETRQHENQELRDKLASAKLMQHTTQQSVDRTAVEIEKLQGEKETLSSRLLELQPVLSRLGQWEAAQADSQRAIEKMADLSADLPRVFEAAQTRQRDVQQSERARPWLEMIFENRAKLVAASESHRQSSERFDAATALLQQQQASRDELDTRLKTAREQTNELSHAVTRADAQYDEACKQRDDFNKAAAQAKCGLCGQDITPEHAENERAELARQIAAAESRLARLREEGDEANVAAQRLEAELAALSDTVARQAQEQNRIERERERAGYDLEQFVGQLRAAFDNLRIDDQSRICQQAPDEASGWIATVYPTDADIMTLRAQAEELRSMERELDALTQQFETWKHLDASRRAATARLAEIERQIDIDEARRARQEQTELNARKAQIQSPLEKLNEDRTKLKEQARNAAQALDAMQAQSSAAESELQSMQGTRDEVGRSLRQTIANLAAEYREQAMTIELEELQEWERERDRLAIYAEMAKELERARAINESVGKRISELNAAIESVPQTARCAATLIEEALAAARICRGAADTRRSQAQSHLIEVEQQYKQHAKLETDLRATERRHHLYKLLAELLGPRGLQIELMRRAERSIVDLANEMLDGLSRGRMRLKLRGEAGAEEGQSNKALDLLVYDNDTGTSPTAVHLASGSQRFRIAVSLALAIGRYAGQGARRIESVIIDEGFGSLDKNGCDDMIERLNELKQQLAKIILVSHQSEFAGAFDNGYMIELLDGASQARLQG